ncbi:hypothetical protein GCM10027596_19170 [Nocardioides korecus]
MRIRVLSSAVVVLLACLGGLVPAGTAQAETLYRVVVRAPNVGQGPIGSYTIGARNTDTGKATGFQSNNYAVDGTVMNLPAGPYEFSFRFSGAVTYSTQSGAKGGVSYANTVVRQITGPTTVSAATRPSSTTTLHFVDSGGQPATMQSLTIDCQGPQKDLTATTRWTTWRYDYVPPAAPASDFTLAAYPAAAGCTLTGTTAAASGSTSLRRVLDFPAFEGDQTVTVPDRVTISGELPLPDESGPGLFLSMTTSDGWAGSTNGTSGAFSATVPSGTGDLSLFGVTDLSRVRYLVHDFHAVDGATVTPRIDYAPARLHAQMPDGSETTADSMVCTRVEAGSSTTVTTGIGVQGGHLPFGAGWSCQVVQTVGYTDGGQPVNVTSRSFSPSAGGDEYTYVVGTGTLLDGPPGTSADADGVPDAVEDLGPNHGDGNLDGTPDSTQPEVATLPALGQPPGSGSTFLTVAGPAGSALVGVATLTPYELSTPLPDGVSLPAGLVSYTVTGVPSGSTQTVSIYPASMAGVNGYAKYDLSSQAWSVLPAGRVTIAADHLDVRLTDGGTGDADGVANGVIVDPGGPAAVPAPVDTTPPTVTGTATTDPNANGWYRGDVTIHWTVRDDGPGTVGAPPDTVVTGEGDDLTATSSPVCDAAGNCATGTVTGIEIDRTAPVVTGSTTTQPNAAGWHTGPVTVHWVADDGAAASSGVTAPPADTTSSSDGHDVAVTSDSVCDRAGNCATGRVEGLEIDSTKPAIAVSGVSQATYTLGAGPAPACAASDATSGLAAACTVSTTGTGPGNGVGTFTVRAAVTDRAGNTAVTSTSYRVVYRFDGFAQPINDPTTAPGSPTSTFKTGDTIPVRFTLRNAAGQPVYPRSVPPWTTPVRGAATKAAVNESVNNGGGSTGSSYRLVAPGAWGYDWSTKGVAAGYLQTVSVALDDGTTHVVVLGLR